MTQEGIPHICTEAEQSKSSVVDHLNMSAVWIAQLVEHRNCDQKVAGLSPGRKGGRTFFSRVNFLCRLFFFNSVSIPTPLLLQWHIRDPSHSAKMQVAGYR